MTAEWHVKQKVMKDVLRETWSHESRDQVQLDRRTVSVVTGQADPFCWGAAAVDLGNEKPEDTASELCCGREL